MEYKTSEIKILFLYILFIFIASITNFASQIIVQLLFKNILLTIVIGTVSGLIMKYILDSRYIFQSSTNLELKNFFLYSFFGALLTPIWWLFEYLGYLFTSSFEWGLFWGGIGLSLSYYLKYLLDKKYVFKE